MTKSFIKFTLQIITTSFILFVGFVMLWALSGQTPMFNLFSTQTIMTFIGISFVLCAGYNFIQNNY